MKHPFTKMQGLGNDFIVIDDWSRAGHSPLDADRARHLCDRRFGIGADQILWLRKPSDASCQVRMEILNADGSTAEMCGNGIRAVALYVNDRNERKLREYRVETLAGVKIVSVRPDGQVTVDMGAPKLQGGFPAMGEAISVGGRELRFFEVNVGNPHAVFFVDDVANFPVEELGALIEKHPRFPKRTNVEFVQPLAEGPRSIRVRVWERGAGITLACGTGACASAAATMATGRVAGPLAVHLPGGKLEIAWAGEGKPVMMTGPAKEVFRGEVEL